jgi:Asp-tRNA(Asn)/Glu-tRNA(Gln) amidotransferase C subunit
MAHLSCCGCRGARSRRLERIEACRKASAEVIVVLQAAADDPASEEAAIAEATAQVRKDEVGPTRSRHRLRTAIPERAQRVCEAERGFAPAKGVSRQGR